MRLFIILLVMMALLTTACDALLAALPPVTSAQAEPPPVDTALIERGIAVYRYNYCGSCHTLTAANTRGTFGPPHNDAAIKAAEYIQLDTYTGSATTVTAYLRESIVNPSVFSTPGYINTQHHMPAFNHLPEDDVAAMVALLSIQMGE